MSSQIKFAPVSVTALLAGVTRRGVDPLSTEGLILAPSTSSSSSSSGSRPVEQVELRAETDAERSGNAQVTFIAHSILTRACVLLDVLSAPSADGEAGSACASEEGDASIQTATRCLGDLLAAWAPEMTRGRMHVRKELLPGIESAPSLDEEDSLTFAEEDFYVLEANPAFDPEAYDAWAAETVTSILHAVPQRVLSAALRKNVADFLDECENAAADGFVPDIDVRLVLEDLSAEDQAWVMAKLNVLSAMLASYKLCSPQSEGMHAIKGIFDDICASSARETTGGGPVTAESLGNLSMMDVMSKILASKDRLLAAASSMDQEELNGLMAMVSGGDMAPMIAALDPGAAGGQGGGMASMMTTMMSAMGGGGGGEGGGGLGPDMAAMMSMLGVSGGGGGSGGGKTIESAILGSRGLDISAVLGGLSSAYLGNTAAPVDDELD